MKRNLFLVLLLSVTVGTFAEQAEINGLWYELVSKAKEAKVIRYKNDNQYRGDIVIPDTVEYNGETYSVTNIGNEAFYYCSGLTSITIPNSVTSLGQFAFLNCSGLTSVTIPNSVTSIGQYAFDLCVRLSSVTIGNNVTTIDSGAFCNCSGLTSVTIPNSVTSLGDYAFQDCSGLTSLTIGNSVTSIGRSAFSGCSGLTSFTIGDSVTSIGSYAFEGCGNINNVKVTVTDYSAFCDNKALGCISSRLGKPVQLINNDGTEITEYVVPEGVTSIGSDAFRNCSGLIYVTIPNSVTSIGRSAFNGCSCLTSVHVLEIAAWCRIEFSSRESNPLYYARHLYLGDEEITDLVIPNSVTSIGQYAFNGCIGLTTITIPNSVTSIGQYAFNGCSGVMTVKSYIKEPFNVTHLFAEETYREGTLYVPKGTKDLYIRFDGWREFLNIEEMDDGDTPAPNGKCATPTIMILGKKFVFDCATPDAEFTSSLTTEENFTGKEVKMESRDIIYTLTVYATALGYERSDPASVKFFINRNDVNMDGTIDVADIATVIDAMAAQAREQVDVEE